MRKFITLMLLLFIVVAYSETWKWGIGFDRFTISGIVMEKKISEKIIISPQFKASFGEYDNYTLGLTFYHPIPLFLTDFYIGAGLYYNQGVDTGESIEFMKSFVNIPFELTYYKSFGKYDFKVGVKADGLNLKDGKISEKVDIFWVYFL